MPKAKYYIYLITNVETGKQYVGQTTSPKVRKSTHFSEMKRGIHPNEQLQQTYDKHGRKSFVFNVIDECETLEDVLELEKFYVAKYDTFKNGYNMTQGGDIHDVAATPCEWNDVHYPTISACAEANNVEFATMCWRIKQGYKSDNDMKGHSAISIETRWNDTLYPSISEAARQNGYSPSNLMYFVRKGYTCDSDVRHDLSQAQKTIWNDVLYPSRKDCAETIGVSAGQVSTWLKKGYTRFSDLPESSKYYRED